MSFWGATVITNLLSILPFSNKLLLLLWADFSVAAITVYKFFALHYLLPFVLSFLVFLHLNLLHMFGSSSPSFASFNINSAVSFMPLFSVVDFYVILLFLLFVMVFVFYFPFYFFENENFIIASSMVTPEHIKPEWYFLFPYAILRAFTSKTVGVIFLVISILSLFIYPFLSSNRRIYSINSYIIVLLFILFYFFTFTGGSLIAFPFTTFTDYLLYFSITLFIVISLVLSVSDFYLR